MIILARQIGVVVIVVVATAAIAGELSESSTRGNKEDRVGNVNI